MKYITQQEQEEFRDFAKLIKRESTKYTDGVIVKESLQIQTEQLRRLFKLEDEFKETIIKCNLVKETYGIFVDWILNGRKNILCARPYFRERQRVFSDNISDAIKNCKLEILLKYHINYQFISFVLKNTKNLKDFPAILTAAKNTKTLRTEMIERNLPLAINRARVFYSRTPQSHVSYMDFCEIAAVGLIHGIDKYATNGDIDAKTFRSTIIGVMGGLFIENYSQTTLHFFPQDRRKLYRAHKAAGKFGIDADHEKIAEIVNIGVGDPESNDFIKDPTNAAEIADLMAAASTVSADTLTNKDAGGFEDLPELINSIPTQPETHPDYIVEENNSLSAMYKAFQKLSIIEKKILRLKGIGRNLPLE